MPTPQQIEQALGKVRNQRSFLHELLAGALGWPIPDQIENLGEIAYDWSEAELRTEGLDRHIAAGTVLQLQPFRADQPWGVFLLEFKNPDVFTSGRGMTGTLRKVLRGLLPRKRAIKDPKLKSFHRDDLLFICTHNYQCFRFAYFKAPAGETKTAPLAAFGWSPDEPARTACELNLPELAWPERDVTPADWVNRWAGAFDVEKVTKRFYEDYKEAFEAVEKLIAEQGDLDTTEDLRLFTQTLFNRLMFLRFIERKNWLELNGRHDYLRALFEAGPAPRQSLYKSRIRTLFFEGLAVEGANKPPEIGSVPFLNGGLFEQSALDKKVKDIPDAAFAPIIASDGLFYRYNFTVEESTPLDIEVAVDPEMLGKVFEELVTGRHESGSYYTPRPVVSFMCREALKGYLAGKCVPPVPPPAESGKAKAASGGTGGTIADSIAALIDRHEVKGLNESHARRILDALDNLKAVDPACGSGAYLLGLLHELIALYRLLYSEKLVKDSRSLYDLKLRIISHNLYGVDIDPFATNTAMLRLWLSLAVEATEPMPLPNLDFKIETGDSLIGPCQLRSYQLNSLGLQVRAIALLALKDRYMTDHSAEKAALREHIHREEKAIAGDLIALRGKGVIDWRIQFIEAFTRDARSDEGNGFDIVLANPPYVRQERIDRGVKTKLLAQFGDAAEGKSDLYVYFYARGLELLRSGGMHVFICSNSWLDVGYGGKLQKCLLQSSHLCAVYESAVERQFSTADINTIISVARKGQASSGDVPTRFVSLRGPFERAIADKSLQREVRLTHAELWNAGLGEPDRGGRCRYEGNKWGGKYLRAPDVYFGVLAQGQSRFVPLGEIAEIRRGYTSGANDFFYVRVLGHSRGLAHIQCDDGSEHEIEEEFVIEPVLVKAKEIVRPKLECNDFIYRLVHVPREREELKGKKMLDYINYAEAAPRALNKRATFNGRDPWYDIRWQEPPHLLYPVAFKRRSVVGINSCKVQTDQNMLGITVHDPDDLPWIAASLLSTFGVLVRETLGRANFGQGLLKITAYELRQFPVLRARGRNASAQALEAALERLSSLRIQMLYDEVRRADRRALDDAFLLAIGCTDACARAELASKLQDAACRTIWTRLARPGNARESRQSYDEWLASGVPFGDINDED